MQTDCKLFSMFYKILLDFSNLSTYFTDMINETNNRRGETMKTTKITLTIETENDSFEEDLNDGVESVLVRFIETHLKNCNTILPGESANLLDSNGNTVGKMIAQ